MKTEEISKIRFGKLGGGGGGGGGGRGFFKISHAMSCNNCQWAQSV